MRQHHPTQPICPCCGYDLSGLVEPHNSCTCPECNTETDYQSATTQIPQRIALHRVVLLLLLVPLILTAITWELMHYTGKRYNDLGDIIALIALLIQPCFIPGIAYLVIRRDARHPRSRRYIAVLMCCLACSAFAWIFCAYTFA